MSNNDKFRHFDKKNQRVDGCREFSTTKWTKIQMKILTNLEKLKKWPFCVHFFAQISSHGPKSRRKQKVQYKYDSYF